MTKNVRLFTLEEANQLLPTLIPILKELQELRGAVDKLEVEIDSLELILKGAPEDGKVRGELEEKVSGLNQAIAEMQKLIYKIESFGCILRNIELGLIDFLSQTEDRNIFLCWHLKEEKVTYWHETNENFDVRKPL